MAVSLVGTPTAPVQAAGSNIGTVTGTWSGTQPRTAERSVNMSTRQAVKRGIAVVIPRRKGP